MEISISLSLIEIGKIKRNCGKLEACIKRCTDSELKSLLCDVDHTLGIIEWKIDKEIKKTEES